MVDFILREDTYKLIASDYWRYTGRNVSLFRMFRATLFNHCFAYTFWLRIAANEKGIIAKIARNILYKLSRQYGLQIPIETSIGYGLYIGHGIGIVVNSTAKIGNNCNLSQFTTIGANEGKAAVIGDNVYIGPSVCLVENVIIGDNVTIGAGAVVVKDVPDDATVAGVPAKIISYKSPGRYINRRWQK